MSRPLLWLTAPPRIFRNTSIEDINKAAWSTTIIMIRRNKEAMEACSKGELKEYIGTKKPVLLGTTAFPPRPLEREYYRTTEEYILFKLRSGADYIIVHDIPVLGNETQAQLKAKMRINIETARYYLKIRDQEGLDVKLIAIPQALTYKDMLRQAKTYQELGVEAIGISLAPWVRPQAGVLARNPTLKQQIVELLRALRNQLYTPIIVLGSQEPNLARELYWKARVLTFEGSFIATRSFPKINKTPLILTIEGDKAVWRPTLTSKQIKELSPEKLLRRNIQTWINYVLTPV